MYALFRDWHAELRQLDRSCAVDADCALVSADLECISDSDRIALNVNAVSMVDERRPTFNRRCAGCVMATDSFDPPVAAVCRERRCVGRGMNEP
jgi:hypothetical protein